LRVVSLVPSVTEIAYALGAGQALAGNTNQCDYPEAAGAVYKVGDFMNPDVERIVALNPTLVFLTLPVHQQLVAKFRQLRIPFYVSRPRDIEAVFAEVESVGRLLGRPVRAESLASAMRSRLDSLPEFPETTRVYVEISGTPLMTAGSGTFINGMIATAGGRNVFETSVQEYPVVDPEAVLAADPQVILLLHPDLRAADLARRVGWQGISAVKQGRIYDDLDEDLFFRPGPRVVDGVVLLARILHPGS
jgi:iron complex transport system substrate-binding protein